MEFSFHFDFFILSLLLLIHGDFSSHEKKEKRRFRSYLPFVTHSPIPFPLSTTSKLKKGQYDKRRIVRQYPREIMLSHTLDLLGKRKLAVEWCRDDDLYFFLLESFNASSRMFCGLCSPWWGRLGMSARLPRDSLAQPWSSIEISS